MDISSLYTAFNSEDYSEKKLPPVHLWNPTLCGDIDIYIDREGTWFHEGSRITRQALVTLFSSILKREGEEYFLVTPAEKCRIEVNVAPLKVIHAAILGANTPEQALEFTTEQGLRFQVDDMHPMQLKAVDGEDYPIVHARDQIDALIVRNVYYQLAEHLEEFGSLANKDQIRVSSPNNATVSNDTLGVRSKGVFFALHPSADLRVNQA